MKITEIILCVTLCTALLSGCSSADNPDSGNNITPSSVSTSSAETETQTDNTTSAVSVESGNGVCLTFNDEVITLPCLTKDLKQFTVDEGSMGPSMGYTIGYLMYNGTTIVGSVAYDAAEDDKAVADRTVVGIHFSPLYESTDKMGFKGVYIGDTTETMKSVLGEPYEENTYNEEAGDAKYHIDDDTSDENRYVMFDLHNGTVASITLYTK